MEIGIFSDSHGNTKNTNAVFELLYNKDIIIFAGDGIKEVVKASKSFKVNCEIVKGNCDSLEYPKEKIIKAKDKNIFITHGDNYDIKTGFTRLYYKAKEIKADIVVYGHTHKPSIIKEDGIIFLNPGSITLPRGWKTKTYAIINISDSGEADCKIHDLV